MAETKRNEPILTYTVLRWDIISAFNLTVMEYTIADYLHQRKDKIKSGQQFTATFIANAFGIKSGSTVRTHLKSLRDKGMVDENNIVSDEISDAILLQRVESGRLPVQKMDTPRPKNGRLPVQKMDTKNKKERDKEKREGIYKFDRNGFPYFNQCVKYENEWAAMTTNEKIDCLNALIEKWISENPDRAKELPDISTQQRKQLIHEKSTTYFNWYLTPVANYIKHVHTVKPKREIDKSFTKEDDYQKFTTWLSGAAGVDSEIVKRVFFDLDIREASWRRMCKPYKEFTGNKGVMTSGWPIARNAVADYLKEHGRYIKNDTQDVLLHVFISALESYAKKFLR